MADSKPLTAITITTATPKIREFVPGGNIPRVETKKRECWKFSSKEIEKEKEKEKEKLQLQKRRLRRRRPRKR